MRLFAVRRMRTSCASAGSSESRSPSKASVAMAEATSPALAPPIPSATAKNGASATKSSSLALRWRPTSVRPTCSTMRRATGLLLVAVLGVADANSVGHLEPFRAADLPAVHVGAVRGAHVLHVHVVAALEDPRVRRGGERIVHVDVRAVGATERGAAPDVERRSRLVAHRGHHLEPWVHSGPQVGEARLAATRARRLDRLRGRRAGAGAREVLH